MSPEKARVLIVEDDPYRAKMVKELLEDGGHEVVSEASNLKDALEAVGTIGELGIQVVTLDRSLSPDEEEGVYVLEAIRQIAPDVKVVGLSGSIFPGTDYDLGKKNVYRIGEVVNDL